MNNQNPHQQMPMNYMPIQNQKNPSQQMPMNNFRNNSNQIPMNQQMNMNPQYFQMFNQFNNQKNMNPNGFQNQQQTNSETMGNNNFNFDSNKNNLINLFFVKKEPKGINILVNIKEPFSSVVNNYINKSGDCNPNIFYYNKKNQMKV